MKTYFASVIFLLVGLAVGFFIGYRDYQKHITSEAVQQMIQGMESSERLAAARGIRAIELIQSGETSNAVEFLSRPIGDFYRSYAKLTHNDKRTTDLLVWIDQIASTNKPIADEIHAKIQ
jgi:hypothetical protein